VSTEYLDHLNANCGPEDEWIDCWQCGGVGMTAGCFEDCCSGADCDPDDAEYCCAPNRCDVCHGKGGWNPNAALTTSQRAEK
jgi:hypothetical protein